MTKRLVLFSLLLISLALVFTLTSYRSYQPTYGKLTLDEMKAKLEEEKKLKESSAHKTDEAAPVQEEVFEVVLDTEELKNGHLIYQQKGQCITCHGKNGEGKRSQLAPAVGGQHDWYLEAQLVAMKQGERVNEKMNPYLKNLSEKDLSDVSQYMSKLRGRKVP